MKKSKHVNVHVTQAFDKFLEEHGKDVTPIWIYDKIFQKLFDSFNDFINRNVDIGRDILQHVCGSFPFIDIKEFLLDTTDRFNKIPIAYGTSENDREHLYILLVDRKRTDKAKEYLGHKLRELNLNKCLSGSAIPFSVLKGIHEEMITKKLTEYDLASRKVKYLQSDSDSHKNILADVMIRAIPSLWRKRGLGLVDIVGYSKEDNSEQMRLKMILISTLRYAETILKTLFENIESTIEPACQSLSTGDGYYMLCGDDNINLDIKYDERMKIWNSCTFLFILFTMYLWKHQIEKKSLPKLKASFLIGDYFTMPYDGFHVIRSAEDYFNKKRFRADIVGDAPNILNRIMNKTKPGQILVSKNDDNNDTFCLKDVLDSYLKKTVMPDGISEDDIKLEYDSKNYAVIDKHENLHTIINVYAEIVLSDPKNLTLPLKKIGLQAKENLSSIESEFFDEY